MGRTSTRSEPYDPTVEATIDIRHLARVHRWYLVVVALRVYLVLQILSLSVLPGLAPALVSRLFMDWAMPISGLAFLATVLAGSVMILVLARPMGATVISLSGHAMVYLFPWVWMAPIADINARVAKTFKRHGITPGLVGISPFLLEQQLIDNEADAPATDQP